MGLVISPYKGDANTVLITCERTLGCLPLALVARTGVWGIVRRGAGEADLGITAT